MAFDRKEHIKMLANIRRGQKFSETTRKRMSLARKGKKPWCAGMKGNMPPEFGQKSRNRQLGKPKLHRRGKNHPNWKGGITIEHVKIRNSLEYKIWRRTIFERDHFTCQSCGEKGGKLNADHILSFAKYPEHRFDISNGRTLCISCHAKTDTYGPRSLKI